MQANHYFRSAPLKKQVNIRFTEEDVERLAELAHKKGLSVSILVRSALAEAGLIRI